MQRYVIRRLLAVIPTLFFASIIVFLVIRVLPGDIVDLIIKSSPFMENSEQMRVEIERDLGLTSRCTNNMSAGSPPSSCTAISALR